MAEVLMGFVGDVHVNRAVPAEVFSKVREILRTPQILFGNLEGVYTDKPRPTPSALSVFTAPSHNLNVFAESGFHVMSLANNHIIDAGYDVMLENRSRLRSGGVKTCGAGESATQAREPAILEAGGLRIAFLAYSATFPVGCEARANTPGLAPMRAYNFFREPFPTEYAPGLRPLITTVPDRNDLEQLADDIARARTRADLIITSFHWGDPTRSFHLTDHETRTARYCIDNGADMVIGHHHHALRGLEWYKGKPIMYGLGHFVLDAPVQWGDKVDRLLENETDLGRYFRQIEFNMGPVPGWPLLSYPEDTHMTAMAWATATREGITDIGFLPCRLTPDGLVNPLRLGSKESDEVIAYVQKAIDFERLKSRIVTDGAVSIAGFPTVRVVPG